MKKDLFEWDDATQKIVEKAVENRELDRATENLNENAKESLQKDFHQFNFEQVLEQRNNVIKSVQQNLGPHLQTFEKWDNMIDGRRAETDFQANLDDNAVDREDWENLLENYNRSKRIISELGIWAFVAHANSQDVGKAVEIRQMQADQNKAMEMVNEHYSKFESAADKIGRQVKEGHKAALKEVLSERDSKIEEIEKERDKLKSELEEERKSGHEDEPEPLTTRQRELVDLANENQDKGKEWFAEEMNLEKRNISKLEADIQRKGYEFEIG